MHNLQEEPTIEYIEGTPQICAALDGWQADHQATIVKIEGKILNNYVSILAGAMLHLRLLIYES